MRTAKLRKQGMTQAKFGSLMRYPRAWLEWEMFPDKLYQVQSAEYEPGNERGAEHFRYGAFGWWVARKMSRAQLRKYIALTWLDPDQVMANEARRDLLGKQPLDPELRRLLLLKVPV